MLDTEQTLSGVVTDKLAQCFDSSGEERILLRSAVKEVQKHLQMQTRIHAQHPKMSFSAIFHHYRYKV